jgi:hypothetical protein
MMPEIIDKAEVQAGKGVMDRSDERLSTVANF